MASGRRVARQDGFFLRRLPSRVDQPPAGAADRRADLRLRLRVQRLPARRARAGDAPDRPAEVHQGARLLDRRVGVVEVDLQHRARDDQSRYGMIEPGQAGPARADRVLGAAGAVGGDGARRSAVSLRRRCGGLGHRSYWIRHGTFPARCSWAGWCCFVLGLQGLLMAVLGEYLAPHPARRRAAAAVLHRSRAG